MKRFALMLGFAALVACGSEPATERTDLFAETAEVAPGVLVARMDGPMPYNAIAEAAKRQCGKHAICKVIGWVGTSPLPKAFPLTDVEAESSAFNYTLNRSSGADELLVDCDVIESQDRARCF